MDRVLMCHPEVGAARAKLRAAEVDIEETVKDERSGGSVFVTLPRDQDLDARKRSLRELAVSTPRLAMALRRSKGDVHISTLCSLL